MTTALALFFRPLVLVFLFWAVLMPARRATERMKDGRLKRLLLAPVGGQRGRHGERVTPREVKRV